MITTDVNSFYWYIALYSEKIILIGCVLMALVIAYYLYKISFKGLNLTRKSGLTKESIIMASIAALLILLPSSFQSNAHHEILEQTKALIASDIGLKNIHMAPISKDNDSVTYYGRAIDGDGEVKDFAVDRYGNYLITYEIGNESFK